MIIVCNFLVEIMDTDNYLLMLFKHFHVLWLSVISYFSKAVSVVFAHSVYRSLARCESVVESSLDTVEHEHIRAYVIFFFFLLLLLLSSS
jgi:hypothetical protein